MRGIITLFTVFAMKQKTKQKHQDFLHSSLNFLYSAKVLGAKGQKVQQHIFERFLSHFILS